MQAGSTVDERVPADTAPHGANTPAQAAAVLAKLEGSDAGALQPCTLLCHGSVVNKWTLGDLPNRADCSIRVMCCH